MPATQPNILLIQADQLAAPVLPCYGNSQVQAPHLDALAEDGVIFENAYCNNPLCAPSRFSMMSGQHTSRIEAFDNGAEFPGDIPTFAHYLRANGYQTCLSGKMHFVGGDQLHGFEERLTTDIYPADHGWAPDWEKPEHRFDWWYHNMSSVLEAGPCERTNQIDFDDETGFRAVRKIYDLARSRDPRPFCLTVSFTDPHDPYACPKHCWDRYTPEQIPLPRVPALAEKDYDPHSLRLRAAYQADSTALSAETIQRARQAYFGQISYIDDKIGNLLQALDQTGLRENTVIVFTADHGDMLGERGLWYKMSLFEWSARVPLLIIDPRRFLPKRITTPVSLIDLLPTFLDLSNDPHLERPAAPLDGVSLVPLLETGENIEDRPVIVEYLGEGAIAPCFMIRQGPYKYIYSQPDPPQLYHLTSDPDELDNLAGTKEYRKIQEDLHALLLRHQDPQVLHDAVLASQKRRRLVFQAHMNGRHTSWDYQPVQDAANAYMRNHLDLNVVESRSRITSKQ